LHFAQRAYDRPAVTQYEWREVGLMNVMKMDGATVLSVVVRYTLATPEDVARELGCDVEQASDSLDGLVDAGWLAFWVEEAPGEAPSVTLTPWGAEQLGLRLDDDSRWVPSSQAQPAPRVRAKHRMVHESKHVGGLEESSLDRRVDPRLVEPWVEIAAADEAAVALDRGLYRGDHGRERLPFPTVLLGLSIPWDGPEITLTRRECRSCGGRKLQAHEYCLKCDNWGLQRLIPREARVRRRRKKPKSRRSLRGGLGR
jgi:hypothetical protein